MEVEKHALICYRDHIKPMMDQITKLDEKVEKIDIKLASLPKALADEFDKKFAEKQRVEQLEETIRWVTRIIIASVIVALLSLIIIK